MGYLTAEQVKEWAQDQPDDGVYCEHCMSRLALLDSDDGPVYMCANTWCFDEESFPAKEVENDRG